MEQIYILYYSKSGNTKMLAERIQKIFMSILTEEDFNIELQLKEAEKFLNAPDSISVLRKSAGFIIGSPDYYSYLAGRIKIFFDDIFEFRNELKGIPAFGFITHGGGGKATIFLQSLMTSIKLNVISPVISIRANNITSETEVLIEKNCRKMLKLLK